MYKVLIAYQLVPEDLVYYPVEMSEEAWDKISPANDWLFNMCDVPEEADWALDYLNLALSEERYSGDDQEAERLGIPQTDICKRGKCKLSSSPTDISCFDKLLTTGFMM